MARFRAAKTVAARYEDGVIGMPDSCMVLSNSERRSAWCSRRWWYAYGNELKSPPSAAMHYGSNAHELLDALYTWWADTDQRFPADGFDVCPYCTGGGCDQCDGSGLGRLGRLRGELGLVYEGGGDETPAEHCDRLESMLDGYLRTYGWEPSTRFRVLAAELAVAAPVVSPHTGKVYRTKVPVIDTDTGWRIANSGDRGADIRQVLLPWFQLLRLDAVEQDRNSGELWIREFKTSATPQSFSRDLGLDTQLPGYMRGLAYAVEIGAIATPGTRVAGYTYDVLGSGAHRQPKRLKSGKLSTDKRQRVPSWLMDEALAETGEREKYTDPQWADMQDLRQHFAAAVDPALYHREWGSVSGELQRRYSVELYADTCRLATMRRDVARAGMEEIAVAESFPRVPLCRSPGGWCAFKGICLQDSTEGRAVYEHRQPVHWLHTTGLLANNNQQTEGEKCLF